MYLDIIFGLVSVVSLIFALWQYHQSVITSRIETGKKLASAEHIKHAHNSLHSITYISDMIVQRCKQHPEPSTVELQYLARAIRAQAYVLQSELKIEHSKLKDWRYGKMIESEGISKDIELAKSE